jgi:hypothetical protein
MSRWWHWIVAAVAFVGFAGLACQARSADPPFHFSKSIKLPQLSKEELISVPLDSDIYAVARGSFPDVRLIDGSGIETSYLIQRATTSKSETRREHWTARDPVLKPLENGGLEIVIHLEERDPLPNGIQLVTPLRNFEQRVQVFRSADGKDWQPAGGETAIFDYAQYMDVRNDTVPLDPAGDRYFRIVVDNVTQELESRLKTLTRQLRGNEELGRSETVDVERRPFRIDRVEFWSDVAHEHTTGDSKVSYPLTGFRTENDSDKKQTLIYVDSRREPLTGMKLSTGSRNFSRRAHVEVKEEKETDSNGDAKKEESWRSIGEATVTEFDFNNLKRSDLSVTFPESREIHYRIAIDNQNSPPLEVTGVEATGNNYELLFMAGPETNALRVWYGSEDGKPATYDTAAIRAAEDAGYKPVAAGLDTQIAHELAPLPPEPFKVSKLFNDTRVLGSVAAVLVAALAWGLYRAGHRLNDLPQDDN